MEELKKKIDEAMKCQFVGEVIFTESLQGCPDGIPFFNLGDATNERNQFC